MTKYEPVNGPTLYFIGVTTQQSSIQRIFPAWAEYLGLKAELRGLDFAPNSDAALYREAVAWIKSNPLALGALVTTHKVNLLRASRDLFDELDPYAQALHEVSSISKRDGKLVGHALDPVTVGVGLDALVANGHWGDTGGHCLILGAGGASLALTLNLHNRAIADQDVPKKVIVTERRKDILDEMKGVHGGIELACPVEYHLTEGSADTDKIIAELPPASLIVNATGLGKDGPGAPTSQHVDYPEKAIVWDFNYRGDLMFLEHARAQQQARNLSVHDGWVYFVFSWTRVIAQVFDMDIPTSGPVFDDLSRIAKAVTA